MPKETWIIASVLTVALLLGLLGLTSWEKKQEVEKVRAELAEAQAAATKAEAEAGDLKGKLADSQARNEELHKEQDIVVHTHQSLEDEMRNALESKDVTISQLQGKLTVNILDRVMFDSGEAELKPAGAAVLRKVAAVLAQHPNIKVHVIGHTDNVPIKAAARNRFPATGNSRPPAPPRLSGSSPSLPAWTRAGWERWATASSGPSPTTPHPKAAPATAASPSSSSPKSWPAPTPLPQPCPNPRPCAAHLLQAPTLWLIPRLGPAPPQSLSQRPDKLPALGVRQTKTSARRHSLHWLFGQSAFTARPGSRCALGRCSPDPRPKTPGADSHLPRGRSDCRGLWRDPHALRGR